MQSGDSGGASNERAVFDGALWRKKKKKKEVLSVLSAVVKLSSPGETFAEFIRKQFEVSFRFSLATRPENGEVTLRALFKNIIK